MVELTGNSESFGVISHGFNNWVFLVPALITLPLIGKVFHFCFFKIQHYYYYYIYIYA